MWLYVIHCDVTMTNDISMCTYHVITTHNDIAMNLFYYVFAALWPIVLYYYMWYGIRTRTSSCLISLGWRTHSLFCVGLFHISLHKHNSHVHHTLIKHSLVLVIIFFQVDHMILLGDMIGDGWLMVSEVWGFNVGSNIATLAGLHHLILMFSLYGTNTV